MIYAPDTVHGRRTLIADAMPNAVQILHERPDLRQDARPGGLALATALDQAARWSA